MENLRTAQYMNYTILIWIIEKKRNEMNKSD